MKNFFLFISTVLIGISLITPALAGETQVGGNIKISLFDYTTGQHNGTPGSSSAGFYVHNVYLFFSQELSDMFTVDIQPEFQIQTGATPKLKNNIGAQATPPGSITWAMDWNRAEMKAYLPYGVEAEAGILKPRFTWDYGAEYYWGEEFNGSKFSANNFLGAMHEAGVSFEKTLELPNLSLPFYVYVLNGGSNTTDNNRNAAVMLHLEPAFYNFRLLGSFLYGKWDPTNQLDFERYSGGVEYIWNALSFRGEYAGGIWRKGIGSGPTARDATPFGYYLKLDYRFLPWAHAMLDYSLADHNFNSFFAMVPGAGEKYATFTPSIRLLPIKNSTIIFQFDRGDWRIKDDSDVLIFNRFVLGWVTTF